MLQFIKDHAQRPLVYQNEKQAKEAHRGKNAYSLWITGDGYKATIVVPGPYDDHGEESMQDVPQEVTNEIAWLELMPNISNQTQSDVWSVHGPHDYKELSYTECIGCKELVVRCCNESFDVYNENSFRHFSSLAEANNFIESCKNMVDGITDTKIASRLLLNEFRTIGHPPQKPPVILVSPSSAMASHVSYEHIEIPTWTCEANGIKRHWMRRTSDPVADCRNSCSLYEDDFGAITPIPIVVEQGQSLQTQVRAKLDRVTVNSQTQVGPVPFPHADRANSWFQSSGLQSRVRILEGCAVCHPCPGEGMAVRKSMKELGFVRQASLPGSVMRWSVPAKNECGNPVLFLESTKVETPVKSSAYIDMTTGKDITGKTFSSASMKTLGESFEFRIGTECKEEPLSEGTYIRANIVPMQYQWQWQNESTCDDPPRTLVSIRHAGKVIHALEARFETPITLKSFPFKQGESRLKPVSRGNIKTGKPVAIYRVSANENSCVYDCVTIVAQNQLTAHQ